MTLSEVFYEAACRMSEGEGPEVSCHAVGDVVGNIFSNERFAYETLMRPRGRKWWCGAVEDCADTLGWKDREYRTFMLLMASEAVK